MHRDIPTSVLPKVVVREPRDCAHTYIVKEVLFWNFRRQQQDKKGKK